MKPHWYNLFTSGSSSLSTETLLAQAEASGLEAQNNLGVLYASGGAFPQDFQVAADCFRKAAENGYALAQANLAQMYALGEGQPKNNPEALKWFRRAAKQGDAGAQFHLGLLLRRLSLDSAIAPLNEFRIESFVWLQLATLQGFYNASAACDQLNLQMNNAEVEEGKRRIATFVPLQEEPTAAP